MTAVQNRPVYLAHASYAPAARYQPRNMFAPTRSRHGSTTGFSAPVNAARPVPQQFRPQQPVTRPMVQPAPWGAVPYTPLQGSSAAYLHRPSVRTPIPWPVVALLSTVIVTIAVAVAWSLS